MDKTEKLVLLVIRVERLIEELRLNAPKLIIDTELKLIADLCK